MNLGQPNLLTFTLILWTLLWKALALWRAAKSDQKWWFGVILIVNTVGILEIVYLFRFAKKRMTLAEIKHWYRKTFFKPSK